MADFCVQCADELGFETDFNGLLSEEDWLSGKSKAVLCEGCGPIQVDHNGRCVGGCDHHPFIEAPNSEKRKAFEYLKELGAIFEPCGSRVTVSPPPMDTDEDWLVLVDDANFNFNFIAEMESRSFLLEGGEHYRDQLKAFASFRLKEGNVNLICTSNRTFFDNHKKATAVCKLLNLKSKAQRIAVFQFLLYDNLELKGVD